MLQRKQKHCDRDADRNMEGLLRLGAGGLPGMGQVILMLRDMIYKIRQCWYVGMCHGVLLGHLIQTKT